MGNFCIPISPLYVPITKKVTLSELRSNFGEGISPEVEKFLGDRNFYVSLMRDTPLKGRSKFYNYASPEDLNALIGAGIIQEAPHFSAEGRTYLKMFFISEKGNTRRRAIFEPRDINRVAKSFCSKVNLPGMAEVVEMCETCDAVEAIDFKSYYYQIEISEEIRTFFSVYINGKLYELKVMPQGGVQSVFIAQELTSLAVKKATSNTPTHKILVYIDNIYIGKGMNESGVLEFRKEAQPFEVGAHVVSSKLSILGMVVDCTEKSIDISGKHRKRLLSITQRCVSRRCSVREILSIFGFLQFCSRVLQRSLFGHCPIALKTLSAICKRFMFQEIELDDAVDRTILQSTVDAARTAINWGKAWVGKRGKFLSFEVMYTDASDTGGSYLQVSERGQIAVKAWHWEGWMRSLSINQKEMLAIARGAETMTQNLLIFTDSMVACHILRRGYSGNRFLNALAVKILSSGKRAVMHVKSAENLADAASRDVSLHGWRGEVDWAAPGQSMFTQNRLWFDGAWAFPPGEGLLKNGDRSPNTGTLDGQQGVTNGRKEEDHDL